MSGTESTRQLHSARQRFARNGENISIIILHYLSIYDIVFGSTLFPHRATHLISSHSFRRKMYFRADFNSVLKSILRSFDPFPAHATTTALCSPFGPKTSGSSRGMENHSCLQPHAIVVGEGCVARRFVPFCPSVDAGVEINARFLLAVLVGANWPL